VRVVWGAGQGRVGRVGVWGSDYTNEDIALALGTALAQVGGKCGWVEAGWAGWQAAGLQGRHGSVKASTARAHPRPRHGSLLLQALGDRKGIHRFGDFTGG